MNTPNPPSSFISPADFLSSIFAGVSPATPIRVRLDDDGDIEHVIDPDFFTTNEGPIFVSSLTDAGVAFVMGMDECDDPDVWRQSRLKPTAVIRQGNSYAFFWALDVPMQVSDRVEDLLHDLGIVDEHGVPMPDKFVPVPPTTGWEIVHVDPETYYAFDEVDKAYGGSAPVAETTYNDAVVLAPYNPEEPQYQQQMPIMIGKRSDSKQWKRIERPIRDHIEQWTKHAEGTKDGYSFVLADMVEGQRLKNAVKTLTGVGIDIDTGTPTDQIDAALLELGVLAIRYTTHSNAKTRTEFKKDKVIKYMKDIGQADADIDDDMIRTFLRESQRWDASMVASAIYARTDHTDKGIMIAVDHAPMPKNRIVIPFAYPFEIASEASTQAEAQKKWAKIPVALAEKLGVPLDITGTDPSRLFYFGRHKKDAQYSASLFGGPLFDWRTLETENPYEALAAEVNKGSSKSKTEAGRALGRWSKKAAHGFQIADVIRDLAPDKIRGNATMGYDIECPFDEGHSNSGDTDDRACFVVNAGEGSTDFFTCSCRHESCRDFTFLDMLGKMIEDGWFPRETIDDENYNAAVDEDAPDTGATAVSGLSKQHDIAAGLWNRIRELRAESRHEEISDVMKQISRLTDPIAEAQAVARVKKATGITKGKLDQKIKEEREKRGQNETGIKVDNNGRMTFEYQGEYDEEQLRVALVHSLGRSNEPDRARGVLNATPNFTCKFDQIHLLRMSGEDVKFVPLTAGQFWAERSNVIMLRRIGERGPGPKQHIPMDIASIVFHTSWPHLPQTPELIYSPVFAPNGTLVREPGWHYVENRRKPEAGLNIYLAKTDLVVPAVSTNPTANDVSEAVRLLRHDLLGDFPFFDVDADGTARKEPSEANALAMLITPFVRRMISGCTPLFLIKKPAPGCGGTLLSNLPMLLFDGHVSSALSYHPDNEEEMQKVLTAAILEDRTIMLFDNVRDLNSRPLIPALTMTTIGGRLLGKSTNISRPNNFLWIGTGINVFVLDEMGRRICSICLNPMVPDPKTRTYRHPDLTVWVRANRGRLIWAILTLVQSWIANGSSPFTARKLPSFDDWARIVGGILENAGIEGFLDNPRPVGVEVDHAEIRQFARSWRRVLGLGQMAVSVLFDHAVNHDLDVIDGKDDRQKKQRFRRSLDQMDGQTFVFDGEKVMVRRGIDNEGDASFGLVSRSSEIGDE